MPNNNTKSVKTKTTTNPKYDFNALKQQARKGSKGGSLSPTTRAKIDPEKFIAFHTRLPAQPAIWFTEAFERQETTGISPTIKEMNDWWTSSENYDESGKNGYKQDTSEFMPTYYTPSGATKLLTKRLLKGEDDVANFVTFVS
jgi:hypothetical protein|tara:strand:- start:63 stop:491 length:429 start_codon:yes stop_codon:yes gene_type:complete